MSANAKAARVLVVSDNADDAAQVLRALAVEFAVVEVSTQPDLAIADFERFRPDVVVLAFDAIERSQAYCHGLLRLSSFAHGHPHRTVILCGKDETRAAFELCKKQLFDDYVLYWPQSHDGLRLAMSVWNAFGRLAAEHRARGGNDAVAMAQSAHALGAVVDRQLTQGVGEVAAGVAPLGKWAAGFRDEVATHVAEMRVRADKAVPMRSVVLVVEDDAFATQLIAKALEKQSFDLAFAASAPAVLVLLRRIVPTVILMDVNMPGMDGLALTEWLKSSPTLSHIPVIMLTGDARRETIARSKAVGAAGFIVKPFTRDGLLAKLAPFLH
ncbi:MAG: response regulator [Caldimonas sp.]